MCGGRRSDTTAQALEKKNVTLRTSRASNSPHHGPQSWFFDTRFPSLSGGQQPPRQNPRDTTPPPVLHGERTLSDAMLCMPLRENNATETKANTIGHTRTRNCKTIQNNVRKKRANETVRQVTSQRRTQQSTVQRSQSRYRNATMQNATGKGQMHRQRKHRIFAFDCDSMVKGEKK